MGGFQQKKNTLSYIKIQTKQQQNAFISATHKQTKKEQYYSPLNSQK